jgi:hypothetical protein
MGSRFLGSALVLVSFFMVGAARAEGVALGARAGTTGLGLEGVVGLGPKVNFRLGYNQGELDYSRDEDDIEYDVNLSLQSVSGLLDWHPAGGGFRFSAGAFYNGNEADGTARPTEPKQIGDVVFTPEQIGTLRATVDFPTWAGYVGFGFGNAVSKDGRWTVLFDIGLMFHSSPDFALTSDGTLSDNAYFQQELKKEEQEIDDDVVSKIRYYPVITLGLAYRF